MSTAVVSPQILFLGPLPATSRVVFAVTVGGRDGPMTFARDVRPLRRLTRHLAVLSAGLAGRAAMDRFAAAGIALEGCCDPLELACSCHAPRRPDRLRHAVAGLSVLLPGDEVAGICLLVAMRPMLAALAGRLMAAGQDHEDAEAMVLAACWASLVEPSADRPRTPQSVMSVTWSRLRTETRRDARLRWVLALGVPVPDGLDPALDPALGVSTLLADARRRRVVTPAQAELVTATRVRDRPVEEVAAVTGISRPALWKARRRAELALAEFVAGTEREAER